MSYLQLGRSLFWFAVVLVVATTIVVIEPGYIVSSCSPLIQNPGTEFFGASLNLTLSIISLVFIVVIFLVQNANQEYSSRLSGVILREPHFLLTIVFILLALCSASLEGISASEHHLPCSAMHSQWRQFYSSVH